MLRIYEVLDHDGRHVAVEITDERETWFYYLDQSFMPSLRLGKVPRKNLKEDYERVQLIAYVLQNEQGSGELIPTADDAGDLPIAPI